MTGFIVVKGGIAYDMSRLVIRVRWSGRRGSAARSVTVTMIDDDGYAHARSEIDVEAGQHCILLWKGKELFRGILMRQEQSTQKTITVTAYDTGIYLANNKDTFHYTDAKASDVFVDVCKRFGIPYGAVADTGYRIPELPKPKTTAYDVICDALSLTYQATGIRYYPLCVGEELRLLERRQNLLQWVIETGANLTDYSMEKSIENVRTRIKLLSKEGDVLAEAIDADMESKIGIFQDVSSISDEMNQAQLTELVRTTLQENNKPDCKLTVNALGQPDVVTGMGVFVIIKALGISRSYYVEEDIHTFQGNYHSMKLKLVLAQDTEEG